MLAHCFHFAITGGVKIEKMLNLQMRGFFVVVVLVKK